MEFGPYYKRDKPSIIDSFVDYAISEDRSKFRQQLGSLESRLKKELNNDCTDKRTIKRSLRFVKLAKKF